MKWIGQNIYDLIARFRNDVYLESISSGTIASGGYLGLDSNNKIVKSSETGDITAVTITTDSGGGEVASETSGSADFSILGSSGVGVTNDGTTITAVSVPGEIDHDSLLNFASNEHFTMAAIDSIGTAGATTNIAAGDLTMYDNTNDGNPTISIGSSATNRFEIKTAYNSGAITLDEVYFSSYTTSASTNDGRYIWEVDEVELARMLDSGFNVIGNVTASDSDATLAATDKTTSSATQGGKLRLTSDDGAAMADDHRLGVIEFRGAEDSSSTYSTGARIQAICRDAWDGSNNDADLEFYTTDGTTESKVLTLDADKKATFTGDLTAYGDTITFQSENADDPLVNIKNITADNQAARLQFTKDRGAAMADNDRIGEIDFVGEDASQNTQQYAKIMVQAVETDHGSETGKMRIQIAEYDGTQTDGLILTGQNADGEVDVTIGAGTASTTTIAGTLTMGSTAAMTNAGLLSVANQSSITGLGTISSGTWEGTDIATDQQKHVMHYQTTGYASSPTNYEISKQFSANTAPFQHDVDIGSDGLTAQTVQTWMRTQGHVMPRACTLKRWTGWATSNGSDTTYIGLFKVTPTRNNNSNVSAVLLEEFSYTALGNAKAEDFDETSFTATAIAAGDIIFTAMKGPGSAQYFNGTFEVEF